MLNGLDVCSRRLYLLDNVLHKHGMDGMVYVLQRGEVSAMMRSYGVAVIQEST